VPRGLAVWRAFYFSSGDQHRDPVVCLPYLSNLATNLIATQPNPYLPALPYPTQLNLTSTSGCQCRGCASRGMGRSLRTSGGQVDVDVWTTRNTQHATRNTQHATRNTRHATRDTQHAARSTRHATRDTRHATRDTRHTTRDMRHAKHDTRHATRDGLDALPDGCRYCGSVAMPHTPILTCIILLARGRVDVWTHSRTHSSHVCAQNNTCSGLFLDWEDLPALLDGLGCNWPHALQVVPTVSTVHLPIPAQTLSCATCCDNFVAG
jgi:hypothetical protein